MINFTFRLFQELNNTDLFQDWQFCYPFGFLGTKKDSGVWSTYKGEKLSTWSCIIDLIATAMYIATRRARLEAREAEFLVFDNETKKNMVSNWATFTNKKFLKEGVKKSYAKKMKKALCHVNWFWGTNQVVYFPLSCKCFGNLHHMYQHM